MSVRVSREIRPQPRTPARSEASPALVAAPSSRPAGLDATPGLLSDRLLDEAALLAAVNRGEEPATLELIERLRPTILKCIRRRLPRWVAEEDLVQSVFGKIFANLHTFSGAVPLEHWVSRIAINTTLSQISYESVRPECRMGDLSEEQESALENCAQSAGKPDNRTDSHEAVEILLNYLSPEERRIVVLLHLEQRSTLEISRLTGLSVSTVKVKAFRSRHKMRRLGQRLLREHSLPFA